MPRRKSSQINTPVFAPHSVESTPEFQALTPPKVVAESLDKAPLALSRPLPPPPTSNQVLHCERNELEHTYRQKIGELLGSVYGNSHIENGCVLIDNEKWEKELYECTLPIIQMIQKHEDKANWESKLKTYGLRAYPWEVAMLKKD